MDVVTQYGWNDGGPSCAHPYLLPPVRAILRASGARRVLDLGCGNGHATAMMAEWGYDVIGVDAAEDGIEQARFHRPDLRYEVASVYEPDLGVRIGTRFDAVVSLEVVEHLFRPRELFLRAHELLRPGGALILSTPYHGYLKNLALSLTDKWDEHWHVHVDGGHIKFFSVRTLSSMGKDAGFRVVEQRGAGRFPGLWKSMVFWMERRLVGS